MTQEPFDRNKPYNHLPLLPPTGEILDVEVLKQWGLASRALAELNRNMLRLPNPNMIINTIALQEAKSSSEIENIFTTGEELYKALSDSANLEKTNPAAKEVIRYREALWTGYNDIKTSGKIELSTIIRIFQKVKNTNQGIRSPQSLVYIKRGDSEFRAGEVIYTPPRGAGVVEEKLTNLVDYLNDLEKTEVDPLIKMAIAHYQFEAIHPFSDGNGRTGRILNLLYLVNQNLISHPVLYLSKYIIEHKDQYYHTLGAVTQHGSWKPWITYMMQAVEHTSKHSNHLIDDIINQMNATLDYGKKALKWYNREVNEALFTQPYLKSRTLEHVVKKSSRTTINKYLTELTALGILTPKEIGNQLFYINTDLIRILEG
ncbi:MAG: Fic family protein [Saprospiraceae bacterium]|nr:Fic family protein [Saprospiraceae bacterium]